MVYISGDNNLEKFVVNDLEDELGAVGSNAQVQVVALADRGPGFDTRRGDWTTTKLFHVTKDMRANAASAVADWGERNMGSPRTLTRFVQWTKTNYPADHYAMYFWGHGWNWHPGWVLEDDTNDDTLDVDEARDVIPSLGDFDVVGYDGCNMASIEIMDLWHGHARAVTGSQEWVGWDGLEYDVFLKQLQDDPGMSARQLAIASSASTTTEKTWSAVDVGSRLDTLLDAVDAWSRALKRAVPDHRAALRAAFDKTRSYWQAKMDKDLYDLAKTINGHVKIERFGPRDGTSCARSTRSSCTSTMRRTRPVRTESPSTAPARSDSGPTTAITGAWTSPKTPTGTSSWMRFTEVPLALTDSRSLAVSAWPNVHRLYSGPLSAPSPRQGPDLRCLLRRAFMRNCVTRATPAMATTTPPPTAAMNRAIPSGMVPDRPRKWTSTSVVFWRMKTMSKISSRSATLVATQAALARVSRGARRVGEGLASGVVGSAGSVSGRDEEGSVVMVATLLSLV